MVFVGNINQSVDVLLKTSSLFDPFPPEMGTDTAFLDRLHCYIPGWEIPKFRPEHFTNDYGFITDYLAEFIRELRKEQYGDALDKYFRLGKNLNQRDTIAVRKIVGGYVKLLYPDGEFTKEQIEEILVFALEMRRRVKEQLKKLGIDYYMLTGSVNKEKRMQMVESFNNDDVPVFCISLKAGGTGLNLTSADIVIHYDPWWNVAVQNQATDRAHRIGQRNTVTVYDLIAENTIEEQIKKLQESKSALAEEILSGEGIQSIVLDRDEILKML